MADKKSDKDGSGIDLLESRVGKVVEQLLDCRKQNDVLQAEITSLQSILRSCKLPGGESGSDGTSGSFSYEEKIRIRQKLVTILQRIDVELKSEITG